MNNGASQRLFLGIALDDAVRTDLRHALGAFHAKHPLPQIAKRVDVAPRNWHVTLVFLGATTPDQRDNLMKLLATTPLGAPFTLITGAVSAFGRPEKARVLWLSFESGVAELAALHKRVSAQVGALGLPLEAGAYTPHLTLARLHPPDDARSWLDGGKPAPVKVPVTRVTLFLSRAGAAGSEYEELASVPLALPLAGDS